MKTNRLVITALLICISSLSSCNRGQNIADIPTPASIEGLATANALTAVAPPEGFRDSVSFPEVDANLQKLLGGRYLVTLEFTGVFTSTPRTTNAKATAEVWFNQSGSRRVVVDITGELLGKTDNNFEAVRLGNDSFMVQNKECQNAGPDTVTAAGLRAGTLVGGVKKAITAGEKATLNGQEAFKYNFTSIDLNLPSIKLSDGGTVEATGGELWVAPALNAVIRFYVNLNVTNAVIFDRALPVDGQVIVRYDLYDVGQITNIAVPNGC
ncbi:MAG: hypothetical protein H0X30_02175 [Anaerolineae bacterium]|nr:hypothetical protein [Anaerolineae bacterium]